jgi:anti-sigma regulatory factor (Ser/Thr protein kinase)
MDKRVNEKEVELTIPVLPNIELLVGNMVSELAHYLKLSPDEEDEVRLATIEACLNAFEHSKSRDGKVHVRVQLADDELVIMVSDAGIGFDPSKVSPPGIEEMLSGRRKRGWGLKLIENLVDSIDIRSKEGKGTTIIIKKRKKK